MKDMYRHLMEKARLIKPFAIHLKLHTPNEMGGGGVVGVFTMCYNRNIYHKTLALTQANEKRSSHFTKDGLSEGNCTPQKRFLFLLNIACSSCRWSYYCLKWPPLVRGPRGQHDRPASRGR